jgi:hypothetical protein
MEDSANVDSPLIGEVAPRETAGRDTIARYRAQFRAAAYECLSILTGKTVDRVYCDYQDDFVSRRPAGGKPIYHFFQVKTKGKPNYQWSKRELFGLTKRPKPSAASIKESFVGKLMLHTVRFNNSCGNVVFLTNIQLRDEVEDIESAITAGNFAQADVKAFVELFNEAFVDGQPLEATAIEANLRRLVLKSGVEYLNPHENQFHALARDAIFTYSEVDLQHIECDEIIESLLQMIEAKSFAKLLGSMSESELDDTVGVGIADLLNLLSISRGAYEQLVAGGDPKAIKNASIIQRKLRQASASEQIIEFCSKSKVEWDIWLRNNRHVIPEFDLNHLTDRLNSIKNEWVGGNATFAGLQQLIEYLWLALIAKGLAGTLSRDLLLGGVFAELVRSESQ